MSQDPFEDIEYTGWSISVNQGSVAPHPHLCGWRRAERERDRKTESEERFGERERGEVWRERERGREGEREGERELDTER